MRNFIFAALLAFVASGCSAKDVDLSGFQRLRVGSASICVSSELLVTKMKISGALGTAIGADTRGIFVTLPWQQAVRDDSAEDLLIFVRPASATELDLPAIDVRQAQPVLNIDGLLALPADERFRAQRFVATVPDPTIEIGRFSAICRDLPIQRECSRPFRYKGLVGAYSFSMQALRDWEEIDNLVSELLRSRQIKLCSTSLRNK